MATDPTTSKDTNNEESVLKNILPQLFNSPAAVSQIPSAHTVSPVLSLFVSALAAPSEENVEYPEFLQPKDKTKI